VSGYRKTIEVKFLVDGEAHAATLRPMLYTEALQVFEASRDQDERRARLVKQYSEARRLLPGAILAIDPPVLAEDGTEVSARDLCEVAYFAGATLPLVEAWINSGAPENPPLSAGSSVGDSADSQSTTKTRSPADGPVGSG
jgi:hypothetical protein